MSGICGWIKHQSTQQADPFTLRKMISFLTINNSHQVLSEYHNLYALATVGSPECIGFHHVDGLYACVQGSIRWADAELTQLAVSQGPALALLEAYRRHGIKFLDKVSGPFALAIIDKVNRRSLIAIDKLGIGSLFFTVRSNQLIFSSNARSIHCHPDVVHEINPQALFDYLYFHMVPSPQCVFTGVEKLMPGQYLLFEDGKPRKQFYWQPAFKETTDSNMAMLEEEFRDILKRSIGRTYDEKKIGTFLSGGIDSSTVTGTLRSLSGESVDTYSIGFNAEGFDEMGYARIAAKHFDTRLHEYYLTPQDVVDAIPLIAKSYDEPFGNASAVPAYYCAKLAKADKMETLLAGDGGDELFGGNERYAKQYIFELYYQIPQTFRSFLLEPTILNFPMAELIKPIAKAKSYINQAKVPLPDRLETYNLLNRMPLEGIFDRDFLTLLNVNEPIEYSRETFFRANTTSTLNRMLFLDWKFTLADNDLRKVNRMCELAQMEVRYPLLDEELLEFSSRLPVSMKLRGSKLRYFFKQSLKDFLPEAVLTKSKHGFGLPFGLWMNTYDPLREIAYESLTSLSHRGIVKPEFIADLHRLHKEYPNYYGVMIWVLMMLEQWLQTTTA